MRMRMRMRVRMRARMRTRVKMRVRMRIRVRMRTGRKRKRKRRRNYYPLKEVLFHKISRKNFQHNKKKLLHIFFSVSTRFISTLGSDC